MKETKNSGVSLFQDQVDRYWHWPGCARSTESGCAHLAESGCAHLAELLTFFPL